MIRMFLASAALSLLAPCASFAVQMDGCELVAEDFDTLIAPALVGTWIVENGPGIMVGKFDGQSMTMPLPPQEPEPLEFVMHENVLFADMQELGLSEVTLLDSAHPHVSVPIDGLQTELDVNALGDAPLCALEDLTRILFSASAQNADIGGALTFFFGLYVIDENRLSGMLEARGDSDEGGEILIRRLITAHRQN